MNDPHPIITLTTDFGLQDEFVGVMKGVIASINPYLPVIDLNHNILPQDIQQAAYLFKEAYTFFPAGTIHVLVVDPGVGTTRKIICLQSKRYCFLAPDNGLLPYICTAEEDVDCFEVNNAEYFLKRVSNTFHGRDIFAPVAAHLGSGVLPKMLGPAVQRSTLTRLEAGAPAITQNGTGTIIRGNIIHTDRFGNLMTNISEKDLYPLLQQSCAPKLTLTIGNLTVTGLSSSYNDVPQDSLLLIIGSRGFLEIACNCGDAAKLLHAAPKTKVTVSCSHSSQK